MAANVETMFYVREKPWHGLGTCVEEAPTSADALRLAGLDWEVKQRNIQVCGGCDRMKTLREKIEESKAWYLQKYGALDWRWTDEGLPYSITDYHSSIGSTLDFSDDDWKVCEENGWSRDEILILCDEK